MTIVIKITSSHSSVQNARRCRIRYGEAVTAAAASLSRSLAAGTFTTLEQWQLHSLLCPDCSPLEQTAAFWTLGIWKMDRKAATHETNKKSCLALTYTYQKIERKGNQNGIWWVLGRTEPTKNGTRVVSGGSRRNDQTLMHPTRLVSGSSILEWVPFATSKKKI